MKIDLIKKYAEKENISFKEAKKEVEDFIENLKETVVKEKKVKFKGVGTFSFFEKKSRYIADPQTGGKFLINPKPTVKFIPSKILKGKLQED